MSIWDNHLEQLNKINQDYLKICEMLTFEEVVLDTKLCQKLEREKSQISPIAHKFQEYLNKLEEQQDFVELLEISNKTDQPLINTEIKKLQTKIEILKKELLDLLKEQSSSFDSITLLIQHNNNTLSEQLQKDICLGYIEFCKKHNLTYTTKENKNTTTLQVVGNSAKAYFVSEIGIHKAINESSSSNCIVYVLDSPMDENISFEDKDIQIQTCRSSGAGGQHINTTDSAIKITHLKSGISTTCQNTRSQFQNKEQALEQLKDKVIEFYQKQKDNFINTQRTKQYKSLNLKDETKTYNYKLNTITNKSGETISFVDFFKGINL